MGKNKNRTKGFKEPSKDTKLTPKLTSYQESCLQHLRSIMSVKGSITVTIPSGSGKRFRDADEARDVLENR